MPAWDEYTNSATFSASIQLENDATAYFQLEALWKKGALNGPAVSSVFRQLKFELDCWAEGKVDWDSIATDFSMRYQESHPEDTLFKNDVLQILSAAKIENKIVTLTCGQLDRKVYEQVANILSILGGKWNKKAGGFVFQSDPTEQVDDVLLTGKVKKPEKYGFFPTPPELAKQVVELADLKPGHSVLEPEAGSGNLADLAAQVVGKDSVGCFELQAVNVQLLAEKGYQVVNDDFLNITPTPVFDRVIMNPPFERQQDVSHVLHAWEFLKPGGKLVSIMSSSVTFRSDKKSSEFRAFVDEFGVIISNPEGSFKPSGTNVSTITVVLDKPVYSTITPQEFTAGLPKELFSKTEQPAMSELTLLAVAEPPLQAEQLYLF